MAPLMSHWVVGSCCPGRRPGPARGCSALRAGLAEVGPAAPQHEEPSSSIGMASG